jgi:aminopeptidase-like protein
VILGQRQRKSLVLMNGLDDPGVGEEIFTLAAEIYPICRSITGDGVRTTLDRLARHIDLEVHEVEVA